MCICMTGLQYHTMTMMRFSIVYLRKTKTQKTQHPIASQIAYSGNKVNREDLCEIHPQPKQSGIILL